MFTTDKAYPLAIIVDLDDTLAKASPERAKKIPKDKANATEEEWDRFMEGIENDTPVPLMKSLVSGYWIQYDILIVTSREEKLREITENWLIDNDVDYDHLFMRPNGNKKFPWDLKEELLLSEELERFKIVLAIDDEERTCKMFNSHGITTLRPMVQL